MIRLTRRFALLALFFALTGLTAQAQTPNPNEAAFGGEQGGAPIAEESSGDPLYGYLGTGFLAAFTIFVVCKSARR